MNDKFLILKLLVAHSLFKNYQENEQPSLKPITSLLKQYDNINKLLEDQLKDVTP